MYLATVVPFGIVWSIAQGGFSLDFPVGIWWFSVLAGLLFALSNIAAFKANTKVEASQFAIITRFRVVVIVAASWLLLGDTLTPLQFLGACIVFGSKPVCGFTDTAEKRKNKVGIYTVIAVLSAVFMGLAITSEKYILSSVNLATYVVIGWGLQAFFMTLLCKSPACQSACTHQGQTSRQFYCSVVCVRLQVLFYQCPATVRQCFAYRFDCRPAGHSCGDWRLHILMRKVRRQSLLLQVRRLWA